MTLTLGVYLFTCIFKVNVIHIRSKTHLKFAHGNNFSWASKSPFSLIWQTVLAILKVKLSLTSSSWTASRGLNIFLYIMTERDYQDVERSGTILAYRKWNEHQTLCQINTNKTVWVSKSLCSRCWIFSCLATTVTVLSLRSYIRRYSHQRMSVHTGNSVLTESIMKTALKGWLSGLFSFIHNNEYCLFNCKEIIILFFIKL